MPKKKKDVGRAACMDEFCHRCRHRHVYGRSDCGRPSCPLYPYYQYAQQEPDISWKVIRAGASVGFSAKKGVTVHELINAVGRVLEVTYGDQVPEEVERHWRELCDGAPVATATPETVEVPLDPMYAAEQLGDDSYDW